MKLIFSAMVSAVLLTASMASAHTVVHHHPHPAPRQNCIPLPGVADPVTSVPADISQYCEPPWVNDQTVWITCQARLTEANGYAICHEECGPGHDNGSAANLCENSCLARVCQYGR